MTHRAMADAEPVLAKRVNFGKWIVTVTRTGKVPILNVPFVAYCRDGELVAALIGASQNVRLHSERILRATPFSNASVPAAQ